MPCEWPLIQYIHIIRHRFSIELTQDSKVNGANIRPTWVLSAPDGPHVGPTNLTIRENMNDPLSICIQSSQINQTHQLNAMLITFKETCFELANLQFDDNKHCASNINSSKLSDTLIARFMGPIWCPSGADMTQVGPMNFAFCDRVMTVFYTPRSP